MQTNQPLTLHLPNEAGSGPYMRNHAERIVLQEQVPRVRQGPGA